MAMQLTLPDIEPPPRPVDRRADLVRHVGESDQYREGFALWLYCCTSCDAVVDGQAKPPPGMDRSQVLLCWFYGHMKSLVRLAQKGLIK